MTKPGVETDRQLAAIMEAWPRLSDDDKKTVFRICTALAQRAGERKGKTSAGRRKRAKTGENKKTGGAP